MRGTARLGCSAWEKLGTGHLLADTQCLRVEGVNYEEQAAQVEIRRKSPNPYYWAGFVLTGDPGSMAGPG